MIIPFESATRPKPAPRLGERKVHRGMGRAVKCWLAGRNLTTTIFVSVLLSTIIAPHAVCAQKVTPSRVGHEPLASTRLTGAHPASPSVRYSRADTTMLSGQKVRVRLAGGTYETIITRFGTIATEYETDSAGRSTPRRGAIVRYEDGLVFGLDYRHRTFVSSSLRDEVAKKSAELGRIESIGLAPEIGKSVSDEPTLRFVKTSESPRIAGIVADGYLMTANGWTALIYYARNMARPPAAARSLLASSLRAGLSGRCGRPKTTAITRECATADSVVSEDLAGRTVLRADIIRHHRRQIVLDVIDVKPVQVSHRDFVPSADFQVDSVSNRGDDIRRDGTESGPSRGGLSENSGFRTSWATVPANATSGPGPWINRPNVELWFWGSAFNAHGHASAAIVGGVSFMFQAYYQKWLLQYGVGGGSTTGIHWDGSEPPSYAGGNGVGAALGAFVLGKGLAGTGPLFWWRVGASGDPLYGVFIPAASVDASAWSGFHFLAPNWMTWVVSFPFNLFMYEGMPYFVVKVQAPATMTPYSDIGQLRFQCSTPGGLPTGCSALAALDDATADASHEYVEAVSDPFPFFGYSDPSKVPVWQYGEIADICENNPRPFAPRTMVGSTVYSTYWSNADQACVPESRPTVQILEPANGATLSWSGGTNVSSAIVAVGKGTDPFDGKMTDLQWSVDGGSVFATGLTATVPPLGLGSHVLKVVGFDSQGLSATANVTFTVSAKAPVAIISVPLNASQIASGDKVVLRGDGYDYQQGPLPDAALSWSINGSPAGVGRAVPYTFGAQGATLVKLTVANGVGIQATAVTSVNVVAPRGNPSIKIKSPSPGFQFGSSSDVILFSASAQDAHGNPIDGAAIRWTSDRDGFLGTGAAIRHTLNAGSCSIVEFVITATVTDISGRSASDQIKLLGGRIC